MIMADLWSPTSLKDVLLVVNFFWGGGAETQNSGSTREDLTGIALDTSRDEV